MIVMKSPAHRPGGPRTLRVNEDQARILRTIGWTDVVDDIEIAPSVIENRAIFPNEAPRQKRKYTRRVTNEVDDEGNPMTVTRPKRRYRRRDMQAEDNK